MLDATIHKQTQVT